jgi:hypothetical protein
MARPRALLCVSIDCERDKGPRWRVRRPASFEGVRDGVVGKLQPLLASFGVKPTYLLSPEVIRDDESAERFARLPGSVELGTHLHAEYVGPGADDDAESSTFQAALSPDVERAKLSTLTELFAARFGARPRSFRAGRFGIGPASLGILADLGYRVDSSVTPLLDWRRAGAGAPSFTDAPLGVYRPDPARPSRPGGSPLWEIPVTIRPGAWRRLPVFGHVLGRAFGPRLPHRWLRPTWGSARRLVDLAAEVLREARPTAPPVVLNVMFHNVEVTPGASPYAAHTADADAIVRRLAALLAFTRDAGVPSVGLADVPEHLA